jgi:hypothetical protein
MLKCLKPADLRGGGDGGMQTCPGTGVLVLVLLIVDSGCLE